MGEGDDKSTLTGNEPLSGSNIGGKTTFFPLTVLPFLCACPSHLLRHLCVGLVLGKCVVLCASEGGGSAITRIGEKIESIRVGQGMGAFT